TEANFRRSHTRGYLLVIALAGFHTEDAEVVGHGGEFLFAADGAVAGNDDVHVPTSDLIASVQPFADIAVIGVRRHPEKAHIAGEQYLLLRQVGHHVAPGVAGYRE